MSTFHAGAGPRSLAVHGRGAGGPRAGANMSYALAAEQAIEEIMKWKQHFVTS